MPRTRLQDSICDKGDPVRQYVSAHMKLILSRKGIDSENGGAPSPIFPNHAMYSIPIRGAGAQKRYSEIGRGVGLERSEMGVVIQDLTRGRVQGSELAHLDPDLDENAIPRTPGWRPTMGQAHSAQGHLANCGVGRDDVFEFFGWFRRVRPQLGSQWVHTPPDLHVIFGWLQVGEVIDVSEEGESAVLARRPWLSDHPHLHVPPAELRGRNVLYVARDRLQLAGTVTELPGAGVFRRFDPRLLLTEPGQRARSTWRLQKWYMGGGELPWPTHLNNPNAWTDCGESVRVKALGQWQESVLDCRNRPEAQVWIESLIRSSRRP